MTYAELIQLIPEEQLNEEIYFYNKSRKLKIINAWVDGPVFKVGFIDVTPQLKEAVEGPCALCNGTKQAVVNKYKFECPCYPENNA